MKPKPRYFVHSETGVVVKVTDAPPALFSQLLSVCREVDAVEYRAARRAQDRAERLLPPPRPWHGQVGTP